MHQSLLKKVCLASLKSVVDKSDVDKLKIVPFNLSKLCGENVVKNATYDELLKKLILLIQANKIFKKNIEDADKKIHDSGKFIETKNFSRLTKIIFHTRMVEAQKILSTKNQVETALNIGDKNREVKKTSTV